MFEGLWLLHYDWMEYYLDKGLRPSLVGNKIKNFRNLRRMSNDTPATFPYFNQYPDKDLWRNQARYTRVDCFN